MHPIEVVVVVVAPADWLMKTNLEQGSDVVEVEVTLCRAAFEEEDEDEEEEGATRINLVN
jgi:hypothetical protein